MTHDLKAAEAAVSGVAGRISAADKASMALQAQPAVLRATIHVTRAATGMVETFELVGNVADDAQPTLQEP